MTCAGLGLALRRFPSLARDAALARFAGPALSGHFLCAEFPRGIALGRRRSRSPTPTNRGSAPNPGSVAARGPHAPLRSFAAAHVRGAAMRPSQRVQNSRFAPHSGLMLPMIFHCASQIWPADDGNQGGRGGEVRKSAHDRRREGAPALDLSQPRSKNWPTSRRWLPATCHQSARPSRWGSSRSRGEVAAAFAKARPCRICPRSCPEGPASVRRRVAGVCATPDDQSARRTNRVAGLAAPSARAVPISRPRGSAVE